MYIIGATSLNILNQLDLYIAVGLDVILVMVTPVSAYNLYSNDINNNCVIIRDGKGGEAGYFHSRADNGTTPSNMTDSNAQLWDNGISAIGTWINTLRNKIGEYYSRCKILGWIECLA